MLDLVYQPIPDDLDSYTEFDMRLTASLSDSGSFELV